MSSNDRAVRRDGRRPYFRDDDDEKVPVRFLYRAHISERVRDDQLGFGKEWANKREKRRGAAAGNYARTASTSTAVDSTTCKVFIANAALCMQMKAPFL